MTHRDSELSANSGELVVLDLLELVVAGIIMNELEALLNMSAGNALPPEPCIIGRSIRDIPDPYKTALQNIVALPWGDGGFTDAQVAQAMKAAGLRSSETSVRRHRRGFCTCS